MVEWQASQLLSAGTWFTVLPVAVVPLWQLEHVPCTCVWSTRSTGRQLEDA